MKYFLVIGLLIALGLARTVIGQGTAAEPAPPAAPEDILRWIDELDADQFLQREEATENLVLAGAQSIEPILESLRAGPSIERDMRAVYVLKQIALSNDPAAEEVARSALAQVAGLRPGTASQNASETLAKLGSIREKRALEQLQALGAKTEQMPLDPIGDKYNLTIDDQWKGADEDLMRLRLLINVNQLTMSGPKVNDQWLVPLHDMPQLAAISISRAKISDEAIQHIVELQQLRLIELKYVPISDASMVHFHKINIKGSLRIHLYGTEISATAAAELQNRLGAQIEVDHRRGGFLGISAPGSNALGCVVNQVQPKTAAAAAGLMMNDVIVAYNGSRVRDFETLTELIALNAPQDEIEIQFVRNAEIRTGIRVKRATDTLGITAKEHPAGCEVTEVARNSVAAYLSIHRGDVILSVNDATIGSPQELDQVVQAVPVNEQLSIDYARRVELRSARVKLGEWE